MVIRKVWEGGKIARLLSLNIELTTVKVGYILTKRELERGKPSSQGYGERGMSVVNAEMTLLV